MVYPALTSLSSSFCVTLALCTCSWRKREHIPCFLLLDLVAEGNGNDRDDEGSETEGNAAENNEHCEGHVQEEDDAIQSHVD